jgi:hypothetical protein
MRGVLDRTTRGSAGDWLRILAFLALPNCMVDAIGQGGRLPTENFDPGPLPHASAIMCDIEQERHCATDADLAVGIPLAAAAVALNTGQSSVIGIDESPEARANCGGEPEAVTFHGPYPEGLSVCLNCVQIGPGPAPYSDPQSACYVKCTDIAGPEPEVPPSQLVAAYCKSHARPSTNHPGNPEPCFADACLNGALRFDFSDPRRIPEPIVWTDPVGVSALGNDLTRTSPDTGQFDSGAVSAQWIEKGDAYVEFSTDTPALTQAIGLAEVPPGCPAPCPDTSADLDDLTFGIILSAEGNVFVVENGSIVQGPDPTFSFGTYAAGDRFRINVHDNSSVAGEATVTYSRLNTLPCTPGTPCPETVFYTHVGTPAHYPLRVDTTFFLPGATLTNVTTVRIRIQ